MNRTHIPGTGAKRLDAYAWGMRIRVAGIVPVPFPS